MGESDLPDRITTAWEMAWDALRARNRDGRYGVLALVPDPDAPFDGEGNAWTRYDVVVEKARDDGLSITLSPDPWTGQAARQDGGTLNDLVDEVYTRLTLYGGGPSPDEHDLIAFHLARAVALSRQVGAEDGALVQALGTMLQAPE